MNPVAPIVEMVSPVSVTSNQADHWNANVPPLARLAFWLNSVLPRARGRIPRAIGNGFGKSWKFAITTDSGAHLAVAPSSLDVYAHITNRNGWEPWIRNACLQILEHQPGHTFVDVGANVGAISMDVGCLLPSVNIVAFEPQRELAKCVAMSAFLNNLDSVEVWAVAVGEAPGEAMLSEPAHSVHVRAIPRQSSTSGSPTVPMVSLDSIFQRSSDNAIALIKIDVEGGELGVLKGARNTIRQHEPAIIFESNNNAKELGYNADDAFDIISRDVPYILKKISNSDYLAVSARSQTCTSTDYPIVKRS